MLVVGLTALPYPVQAQNFAPGYYYSPPAMPGYAPYYPYGWQAPPAYYYPQYAPYYAQYPQYQASPPVYPLRGYPYATTYVPARPSSPVTYTPTPWTPAASAAPRAPSTSVAPAQATAEPMTTSKTPSAPVAPVQATVETIPAPTIQVKEANTPLHATPVVEDDAPVVASEPHSSGVMDHCPHRKHEYFSVFAEGLFWTVRNADVPYAQQFNGVDPALSQPRGPVGVAGMAQRVGFRGGVGIAIGDDSWLVGTFTDFQDRSLNTTPSVTPNVLHSFLVLPNTVNAGFNPMTADATYRINLVMGDADYLWAFCNTDCFQLSWLGGARVARLQQTLDTDYQQVLGTKTVDTKLNFDGAGPRTGLVGEYRAHWGGFVYGKGIVDLLVGRFGGTFTQRDIFGGLEVQSSVSVTRVVPITELELGLGWRSPGGHISASAGYYVGGWFNTVTTNSLVAAVQGSNYTTNGNNFRDLLIFDGLVGRVEFRY
jgi:hypothetical protein